MTFPYTISGDRQNTNKITHHKNFENHEKRRSKNLHKLFQKKLYVEFIKDKQFVL